jgi:hypothetical protein
VIPRPNGEAVIRPNGDTMRNATDALSTIGLRISAGGLALMMLTACGANGSGAGAATTTRSGAERVAGRLPPPLVQSIVRARYPLFQKCYGAGLGRDPQLEGRIQVRFVIVRDGSVSHVATDSSTLLDSEVLGCVLREFYQLRFPEPDGGMVTVVYSLILTPR